MITNKHCLYISIWGKGDFKAEKSKRIPYGDKNQETGLKNIVVLELIFKKKIDSTKKSQSFTHSLDVIFLLTYIRELYLSTYRLPQCIGKIQII